jgi:hypothetical protein
MQGGQLFDTFNPARNEVGNEIGKENFMSNNHNRVLSRIGARPLTEKELEGIAGGLIPTRLTVLMTGPASHPDQSLDT